jgi:hypothetical protein
MDFRSNEAGRTAPLGIAPGDFEAEPISARSHSVSFDATQRGRRSFVAHHENRNAFS